MLALLVAVALLLVLAGGWLYLRSGQIREASGLPAGELIYVDTGNWHRNDKPLFSSRYQLAGKPDYLVKTRQEIIPVEVKSTRLYGKDPYNSHKLQLAAYCLLIEDTQGVRPSHGILHYADATIRLPYTDALRKELLTTLEQMRSAFNARDIRRSHQAPARCARCGFHDVCGSQALA